MRQVFPEERPVDHPLALLADDNRPAPDGRPWLMANMVTSVDGAWAVAGRSGALSADGDRTVFHCLRALADVILVAAGTARAERYRRPQPLDDARDLRRSRGQAPVARLVVVSRSLHLPVDQPFLHDDGPEPLMVHPETADPAGLPAGVQTRACGGASVDLAAALRGLADDGARLVLCEGGPGLLGQLHHDDLLDELFVTIAPHLVGGHQVGFLGGVEPADHLMVLHRLLVDDDSVLATYRRPRPG